MTLAEKLGQMTQGELHQIKDESDIVRYALGSVLSGGDADPTAGNGFDAWRATIERLVELSRTSRLRIPILYGVDAVHGHNNVQGAVIFPHNVGLGCTGNAALVEEVGRITALEIRATGAQWTFAPCVAVPRDERWGRAYEGFSEDNASSARLGAAAVRGLQTASLDTPTAVLACAKHYLGDGGTSYRPRTVSQPGQTMHTLLDQGDTQLDEATLRRIHLPPYEAAIAAGVGSIMVSYNSWNGREGLRHCPPAHHDPQGRAGLRRVPRLRLLRDPPARPDYKTAVMKSINAGMDMAMEPASYARFIAVLTELVNEGRVPLARIDDAVTRILRVKQAMGLLDPQRAVRADRKLERAFGSEAHRAVARRAVRESLVVLRNEARALPLTRTARRIHVAGRGADDIGVQCGGWTIKWQGQAGAITRGTTLRAAIAAAAGSGTHVSHSLDGSRAEGADVVVAVVGEQPYAEGVGDRESLELDAADVALVERLAATGARVVVLVVSGRPLILGPVLDMADAGGGLLVAGHGSRGRRGRALRPPSTAGQAGGELAPHHVPGSPSTAVTQGMRRCFRWATD